MEMRGVQVEELQIPGGAGPDVRARARRVHVAALEEGPRRGIELAEIVHVHLQHLAQEQRVEEKRGSAQRHEDEYEADVLRVRRTTAAHAARFRSHHADIMLTWRSS